MTLRAVEELCREQLQSIDKSEIIVATQTLSYGVNLAVTSVCICGQTFFKAFRDGKTGEFPLSNCEYHNMVGRCGRYAKTARVIARKLTFGNSVAIPAIAKTKNMRRYREDLWLTRQFRANPSARKIPC